MKHLAAFLLVALPMVCICQTTEPVEQTIPLPTDHIVLQPGEATVTSAGITVFADAVNVFICPKLAHCLLPNNSSASLRLARGQETHSVRLFAFPGILIEENGERSDSVSVRLGSQLYKVILKGQYRSETDRSFTNRALLQVASL